MLFRHFSVASILAILLSALLANQNESGLRVLFLSADTGGGHRASALSLAKQVRRRMSKKTMFVFRVLNLLTVSLIV